MNDNSLLWFLGVMVVVMILWGAYKLYQARIWEGKRRSAAAQSASKRLDTRPIEYTVLKAQQTTRWSGFVYTVMRRARFVIMGAISLLLALVYLLVPVGSWQLETVRVIVSVIILGGLAIGLSYLHAWVEQEQRKLARRIQWSEEQLLISYGVTTRQPATGLYTRDFLIQMLETFIGQVGGESLPLACVMLEIRGLAEFAERHGQDEAADVLKKVGKMLSRSARPYDLTGHDNDQRLILILLRYPVGLSIRERFVGGTQRRVLDEINRTHNSNLELIWTRANLPDDAPTPLQLLSRARHAMDHPERESGLAPA